jgi:hypothetical protein
VEVLQKYTRILHCVHMLSNHKVLYISRHSTGRLEMHFRGKHRERHNHLTEEVAEEKLKFFSGSAGVSTLHSQAGVISFPMHS